jgi:hypothetical protein
MTALFGSPEFESEAMVSGAEFSPCRTYRYSLWRIWDENLCKVMFIGLNPSTATETENDPTVRRCINFAKEWGFGGMFMMNAYAFRATLPKDMKAAEDPVGPGNNKALCYRASQAGIIVACWGTHCSIKRAKEVFHVVNQPIHHLGLTKSGNPKHPLYLRSDTKLELLWCPGDMQA